MSSKFRGKLIKAIEQEHQINESINNTTIQHLIIKEKVAELCNNPNWFEIIHQNQKIGKEITLQLLNTNIK